MRAARRAQAIALEPIAERRAKIDRNDAALGVPSLDIRDARAADDLASLPPPDAIFIGGGLSERTIDAAIVASKRGGRLVAHAVTLESEGILLSAYARHRGELVRLTASHAEPIGGFSGWRPLMPITQFSWRKP
jgi:precorrin-6Y C5,15-methyltransferase (decarboxylating)